MLGELRDQSAEAMEIRAHKVDIETYVRAKLSKRVSEKLASDIVQRLCSESDGM